MFLLIFNVFIYFVLIYFLCGGVVAQAISAQDEKLSQTMFLPLAERMVEKMVKEDKIEAEAEVKIVIGMILKERMSAN